MSLYLVSALFFAMFLKKLIPQGDINPEIDSEKLWYQLIWRNKAPFHFYRV
jgi:hypothetical protein